MKEFFKFTIQKLGILCGLIFFILLLFGALSLLTISLHDTPSPWYYQPYYILVYISIPGYYLAALSVNFKIPLIIAFIFGFIFNIFYLYFLSCIIIYFIKYRLLKILTIIIISLIIVYLLGVFIYQLYSVKMEQRRSIESLSLIYKI